MMAPDKLPLMVDDEIDGMKQMASILESFDEQVRLRMMKFVVAQQLGWSGVRFQRTLLHIQEVPTEELV